jgi:Fe-S cluster assembly iron-binding protein IscA
MVRVTESAAAMLRDISDATEGTPRITVENNQLSLHMEDAQEGDEVVEHENMTVLLISQEASGALDGMTIDRQETAEGARLTVFREAA